MTEELADRPQPPVTPAAPSADPVSPPTYKAGRIRGLDGPRGVACWAVLIVHVANQCSPDTMAKGGLAMLGQALIFFFALSGFLLYLPYVRALLQHKQTQPDTRAYVIHRLLRVFPGYLVIFLIVNFALQASFLHNEWASSHTGTDAGTGMITDPGLLATNLTLLQSYFPHYLQTGISPSWSLTLELVFYACLPVFGAAMWFLRRRFGTNLAALVLAPPAILIVLGIAGKILAAWLTDRAGITTTIEANWGPNWAAVVLRSFLASSDNFAFGMLATVVFVAVGVGMIDARRVRPIRIAAIVAIVPSLLIMLVLIAAGSNFQSTFTALASGLLILIIVLPMAAGGDSVFARALDWRPLEYLGRISLSIYLWHFPVIIVLIRLGVLQGDSWAGLAVNIVACSAVSFALASVTFHLVEKPAMTYARRFKVR